MFQLKVLPYGSYTENSTLDKLVLAFLIVRIIVCAFISIVSLYQCILESHNLNFKAINPRLIVLLSLFLWPIFRIIYCIIFMKVHDFGFGSTAVLFGIGTTFFILTLLFFVWCFRFQLLYTIFTVGDVTPKHTRKVWFEACLLTIIGFIYSFMYLFISLFSTKSFSNIFYTAGFCGVLVISGFCIIRDTIKLRKFVVKSDSTVFTGKVKSIVQKSIAIAVGCVMTVLLALIRDLIVFVINLPMDSNYRYLSVFLTFILESTQSFLVMNAIAEKPLNYITFRRINEGGKIDINTQVKLGKFSPTYSKESRSCTIDQTSSLSSSDINSSAEINMVP